MNILVTGGLGYIGSHTCLALLEEGHSVIVADNLINSKLKTLDNIKKIANKSLDFHQVDVSNEKSLETIFSSFPIDGIIHFAGLKAVGESVEYPLNYYYNNLVSTIVVARMCERYDVKKLIFSSSATVYGDNEAPFFETMSSLKTTNPYGESKAMCERILIDFARSNPSFSVGILRYFNPIGAHESALIGDSPNGIPNNLMPYLTQVAKGKLKRLRIFGDDYPTIDGTGVRDYIHVMDLAAGHVSALYNLKEGIHIYNLGSGKGTSVLELIQAFEKATKINIPYEIVNRRPGDIASCWANTNKANKELKWIPKRDLLTMCRDSWRFERNH
ncbi:UDP-glucose 4-epimerase GalE [Mangrovibacillus sp. Mu-81]|uniref:UDP-glucose 4-epimerase GalE n=1 Tax=Mangrovibacillus sp. Mu-81 TaxID=3121478 RepID=UPI002FE47FF5